MSILHPPQPYNGSETLVVSMDIGTTQSAVSFIHLRPGAPPRPRMVDYWPGQAQSRAAGKVPTLVFYQAGVMRACGENAIPYLEAGNPNVAQWFKLHIHPSTMSRSSNFAIPPMPPGVSVERAYRDMMRYLMDSTQVFFERNTPNGNAIWARLRDNMVVILATPNGWGPLEQATVRTAAVRAGIVTRENAERLLRFVTEAESAVHYALAQYPEDWLEKDSIFSIVDAGGSTVDITVYKCVSTRPLRIQESYPSECIQAGGIFVNREVKTVLSEHLRGSPYADPVIINDMLDFFEKEIKPKFDGSQRSYQLRFGGLNDTDPSLGILEGKITISMEKLKRAFDNAVNQIITCCTKALRDYKAKYILLVGGFGESPYLRRALTAKFGTGGTQVIGVGNYSRKAAAEGATIGWAKELVKARVARATIGGCVRELYDHKLHGERKHCAYTDTDGTKRVDNVFHLWVNKGAILQEDNPHRLHYHSSRRTGLTKKSELASQLGKMVMEVYAWEGDGPIPRWCRDENGRLTRGMTLMCTLDADLSTLASSLKITGSRGSQFYRVDYDVCVYFGGTSLRASLEWHEGNRTHRGPVAVIDAKAQWW